LLESVCTQQTTNSSVTISTKLPNSYSRSSSVNGFLCHTSPTGLDAAFYIFLGYGV
jgi:hypothetical protein